MRYGSSIICRIWLVGEGASAGPAAWADLERQLAQSPYASKLTTCGPLGGVREQFETPPAMDEYLATREAPFGGAEDPALLPVIDPAEMGRQLPDEALRLRLRWDGVMMLEQYPEALYRVNLNKLEKPAEYFQTMRMAAALQAQLQPPRDRRWAA